MHRPRPSRWRQAFGLGLFAVLLGGLIVAQARAASLATPSAEAEADTRRISALLTEVQEATNTRDIPRLLRQATEDVVVVSKNGETLVGAKALEAYLRKMIGAAPALREIRSRVRQDGPPVVQNDTALTTGRSDDLYVFTAGMRFEITTTWSAMLVRTGLDWRIARLHFSFNLFDNPLLNSARFALWLAVGAALAGGLGAVALGAWLAAKAAARRRG